MKRLTVLLMLAPLGCGKPEPPAKTEPPKEAQVIRKDGWVVIAPPAAVCTEKGGEIVIVEHGSVTTIRFGREIPDPRPRVPPPEGKPFPPSGPSVPPIPAPVVPPIPDPLPLPSPLPLPGQLPLPGTLPLPGINR